MRNYELAYWGPNTAKYQIGSPYSPCKSYSSTVRSCRIKINVYTQTVEYSEFDDMFLDEKGDEWLPLGKSFQEHVKLYIEQYVKDLLLHSGIYIIYICTVTIMQKSKLSLM